MNRIRRLRLLVTAISCIGALLLSVVVQGRSQLAFEKDSPPSYAASTAYTVTLIGPFGRQGRVDLGINSAGHVTGEGAGGKVFLYDGSLHVLGKPPGSKWAVGQGISRDDVIVATAQPVSGRRAYVVTYRSGRTAWRQLPGLAGDDVTEASAILPDGSAIAGEVCSSGDHACASHAHPPMAAIWVRYGTDCNAPPRVLPTGNAGGKSVATSIARANKAIVAAGSVQGVGAVVWPLGGRSYLHLTGTASFPQGVANDIAHGPGGTFYVAGTLNEVSGTSVMEAVLWTISCTRTTCRQTRRTILNRFGEAFAVNGQGVVAGYSRPNGDGAGFDFIWQNRLTTKIPADPLAINNSGEIGAVSVNMKTYRPMAELLEPLASPIRPALACHRPTVHGTPAGNASL